jgi:sugar lactone lactonase YvrE
MSRFVPKIVVLALAAIVVGLAPAAAQAGGWSKMGDAKTPPKGGVVRELAAFAAPGCVGGCGSGSTVGPDRALYVTDGPQGRVLRVDPKTGVVTTFASGLPPAVPAAGIGGAMDVEFVGRTAYVLVTLVGPSFGQPDVVDGIYRIRRNGSATAIADIGAWSIANPPATDFFIDSGVQYALQEYRGELLVTDGHHNRVLRVSRGGDISPMIAFGNIVPTGLEVQGKRTYMGQAGPIPHLPQNGKVVTFTPHSAATEVASGAPLIVDVELGPCHRLYALSQGVWDLPPIPENEGAPASADTGRLLRVRRDGSLASVAAGLDRPTSVEFIGNSAFVTTLTGKVLRIDHADRPH